MAHAQDDGDDRDGGDIGPAKAAEDERQQQLDAQAQQYIHLMQPLIWRELEFIRLTCDLMPQQRPQIKAAAENAAREAARDIVQPQRSAEGRTVSFARQRIRSELGQMLRQTLTPEQQRRFTIESVGRSAANRQASIACAVARLDDVLLFTSEQRVNVAQALEREWQDDWEQWPDLWRYPVQYHPAIPDQVLTPHLNDEQKAVWSGLQKIKVNRWVGLAAPDATDDAWWEGKSAGTTGAKVANGGANQ